MHPHAPPRRRSSAGIVFTLLLLLGFLFVSGVLLAVVGAFVFARAPVRPGEGRHVNFYPPPPAVRVQRDADSSRTRRVRAEARSQQAPSRTRWSAERGRGRAPAVVALPAEKPVQEPIRVVNREIMVQLDGQGQIEVDGKSVERKRLMTLLRDACKGRESALIVTVEADQNCRFEHVDHVFSVCRELDIRSVRITAAN